MPEIMNLFICFNSLMIIDLVLNRRFDRLSARGAYRACRMTYTVVLFINLNDKVHDLFRHNDHFFRGFAFKVFLNFFAAQYFLFNFRYG